MRAPSFVIRMIWYECSTLAEPEAVDAVAEVFGRLGQGVAIEEPFVSSADGEQVRIESDKPVLVKTYLPQDGAVEERQRRLEEAIWHLGQLRAIQPLQTRVIQEEDWAEAWKQHFFVQRVGQRLVIVPSWRRHRTRPGDVCVRLDPGMAFGTGLHPTTRLCLRALEARVTGGQKVLDLGTGSGILAIAAAKLGAGRMLALDLDPVAVRTAAGNVALNRLAELIEVRPGTLPPEPGGDELFDLIVANISVRVLGELRSELRSALPRTGLLILSGVLDRDARELLEAFSADGWRPVEQQREAEWSLLILAAEPG